MDPIWKPLKFKGKIFEEYEVSTDGRIKRVFAPQGRTRPGKILKPVLSGGRKGHMYVQVILCSNGKHTTCRIHRAVMETFVGDPLDFEINHKDGNKLNNSLSNLEYCTRKQNVEHSVRYKLMDRKGTNHPMCRLTETQVIDIKRALNHGEKNIVIAHKFGISNQHVAAIKLGKRWSHIAPPLD